MSAHAKSHTLARRPVAQRRNPAERFIIAFPRAARLVRRVMLALPSSRPRRWLMAESARWSLDGLTRGDFDVFLGPIDPACQIHTATGRAGPGAGIEPVYRRHEGYRRFMKDWLEPWSDHRLEVLEMIELEHDRVFFEMQMTARGAGSGIDVVEPLLSIMRMEKGNVVEQWFFWDRAEGHAAAGLTS